MNAQKLDSDLLSTRKMADRTAYVFEESWNCGIPVPETDYLACEDDAQVIDEHIRGLNYAEGF